MSVRSEVSKAGSRTGPAPCRPVDAGPRETEADHGAACPTDATPTPFRALSRLRAGACRHRHSRRSRRTPSLRLRHRWVRSSRRTPTAKTVTPAKGPTVTAFRKYLLTGSRTTRSRSEVRRPLLDHPAVLRPGRDRGERRADAQVRDARFRAICASCRPSGRASGPRFDAAGRACVTGHPRRQTGRPGPAPRPGRVRPTGPARRRR